MSSGRRHARCLANPTENYLRGLIADLFPHLDATEEAGHLLAVLDGLAIARAAEPVRMPHVRATATAAATSAA